MDRVVRAAQREIRAAGAVLWRPGPDGSGVEVAVVHRPKYDDWSLPKGKLDAAETVPAAAAREVTEETGFRCVLGAYLAEVGYLVEGRDGPASKVVDYFSARSAGGAFTPNHEVDELRWLGLPDAAEQLSHDRDAAVLERFRALGTELTTVLLLRHAQAGERSSWQGDDRERPLTAAGLRQAEAMRGVLRLFGPDRVFSAPRLRCVQTVRGLAEDLGVEVVEEELFSEEGYLGDPLRAVARLSAIAAEGGTPVISSQGAVIPHLVGTLAKRAGLPLDDVARAGSARDGVPAKKGSVWLLAFHRDPSGPRLATAHYLPNPEPGDAEL